MASQLPLGSAAPALTANAAALTGATISQQQLASCESTANGSLASPIAGIVAEQSAAGLVLCQRYRLLEQLGAGAMGTVYRALDQKLDRQVAIKLLPEQSVADPEAVARFQREARALAKLSHPHIVQAYDADEDNGCHFLVMELVAGQTLAAVLREKGPLSPTRAATFGYQAALGLHHAHERGLVHRDLKPSNLLRSADGQVKILDLGLARFLQDQIGDATLTTEGLGMGTPDYMAPEQFHNARNADARSDIYSLGCTLYHLIAGRVPFPTSSLTEKYAAHEHQAATPLEELCPDVPAGLAAAIGKMMAKRPDDRYASALHAAEALAPYIAGSSQAIAGIQATASWHGSQAGPTTPARNKRRTVWISAIAGAGGALIGLLLVVGWYAGLFGAAGESPSGGATAFAAPPVAPVPETPVPQTPVDPNVLTVAQDGSGQFRTLGEALGKVVRPNMTIRILDDAEYIESLRIDSRSEQAGLKIDSPHGATLTLPPGSPPASSALSIRDVPDVCVKGLRIKSELDKTFGIVVIGTCTNLVLEDLHLQSRKDLRTVGLTIESVVLSPDQSPAIVRRCTFSRWFHGAQVLGENVQSHQAVPVAGVCFHDCSIVNCVIGFAFGGRLNRVLFAGNRIWDCQDAGILFDDLFPDSDQIAILNNSISGAHNCLAVKDTPAEAQGVELVNNLLIASSGPDTILINVPAEQLNGWHKHHNWRQMPPAAVSPLAASGDRLGPVDALLPQQSGDADYLRPKAGSPLVSAGAGGALPAYVGAMPPPGASDWDWQKTWLDRFAAAPAGDPNVRTVAKNGSGQFRTLEEALRNPQPKLTIQVLDDATYTESLAIDARLAGLTLLSLQRATLEFTRSGGQLVTIEDAPQVTIRGFRLQATTGARQSLIVVKGRAPGLLLDDLQLEGDKPDYDGIVFWEMHNLADDPPAIVQNCVIRGAQLGITLQKRTVVAGQAQSTGAVPTNARIVIKDNLILRPLRGIYSFEANEQIQIVGNRVCEAEVSGIHVFAALGMADMLIANNTCFACGCGILVASEHARPDCPRVELANNLVLGAQELDMLFAQIDTKGDVLGAGDVVWLTQNWKFRNNWRETAIRLSNQKLSPAWIPVQPGDLHQKTIDVQSRQEVDMNFLKPPAGSALATGGAGGDLPAYIGAVPPPGTAAWDWNVTWQTRFPPAKKEQP